MITKIEKLKNIGNFEDYTASGDVTLKKLSIVYANNGAGKTTLARVLQCYLPVLFLLYQLLKKLLLLFGGTNFHFFNNSSFRMLFSFLHWNEATCFCASCFFYSF